MERTTTIDEARAVKARALEIFGRLGVVASVRARALVEEMDYGRRRPEVDELARALGEVDVPEANA